MKRHSLLWLRAGGRLRGYILLASAIVLAAGAVGCARTPVTPPREDNMPPPYTVGGKVYYPLSDAKGYVERGIASWYGEDFHGKKTSNGEVYDMYAKTAAHRILPFGTRVEVANLTDGKKTVLRINDRGPFVKNRVIDLSYAGARDIGLVGPGTAPVEIRVVGADDEHLVREGAAYTGTKIPYWTGEFSIQLGAFEEFNNALRLKGNVSRYFKPVEISTFDLHGRMLYRVRAGKFRTLQETVEAQKELNARGYGDNFVVAE
ncbi:MAG: septal ring lytic transglycosylase RlpA family protein [Deltaproteobacteria bacterium]|nr:septal ring lytic transglycosylase RlpA family protein [Deltaproteobacteria bacterium]